MQRILIDSGILLSYYQQQEPLHQAVIAFFDQCLPTMKLTGRRQARWPVG